MDGAVVIAALILNPTARRKRVAQASEPAPMPEATVVSASDVRGSNPPEKSDPKTGGGQVAGVGLAEVVVPAESR